MTRTTRTRIGLQIGIGAAMAVFLAGAAGCGQQKTSMTDNGQPADQAQSQTSQAPSGTSDQGASKDAGTAKRAPQTAVHTLPKGTTFVAALENTIDTGKNHNGDPIRLRTTEATHIDGVEVVPAGSTIRGEVAHVDPAGRVAGGAELTLRFTELILPNGKSYPIWAEPLQMHGKGQGKESAEEIGGGAAAGAIIGGIAGGGSGAAKGAAAGAVVGTGVAVATKGKQIVLPAGQKVRVNLTSPVMVSGPVAS